MIAGMRCDNAPTKFTPTARKRKGGQAAFSTSQCQRTRAFGSPALLSTQLMDNWKLPWLSVVAEPAASITEPLNDPTTYPPDTASM